MSAHPRQPLAPKTNTHPSIGEASEIKGKEKDTGNSAKTNTPASEDKAPAPRDKGKGKAKPISSTRKENVPRSLDRLFSIDISRALNVQAPTRYDPYYRFPGQPNKPPVYAPYNSEVLEELARVGVTDYSLALSEDSRCWRLNELMRDPELMRKFMKNPKGWTVRLGPRGQEIDYNVEDIVAAHMGMEPTYSSSSGEDFTPDPCNTPRPSTPYCAREREYLKATMDWAGMYDRLDDREEALAKARSDRSRSTTPSSSSSTSTAKGGGMARATSIPSGLSEKGKKESVVWKTAFEDTLSKEELGRQLDEQAAQAKDNAWDDTDSDSDDDEYGSSKSLFRAVPKSDTEDEEEPEMPRNSVFRAWNDIDSDDEDQVDQDGEEDSDDDISECDIEPDPSSPSTQSTPGEDKLDSSESPSGPSQMNQAKETEKELEKKVEKEKELAKKMEKEKELERETDRETEMEREKEKEYQQQKVVPTPYVRPNARSFLQMFFRPPADPTSVPASDDQVKQEEVEEVAKQEVTETPLRQTCDVDNKDANPTLAKVMLQSADCNHDIQPSRILSVDKSDSDEEEDDYGEGVKGTPDTSLDSYSDAEADEKGQTARLHSLFRLLEEDGDEKDERDGVEDGDEDGHGEDEDGDEHNHYDSNRHDDDNKGGNNGGNGNDNEDNGDDHKDGIDGDDNEDKECIQNPRTDTRDHDNHHVHNKAETDTHDDSDAPVPYDPYAGMTYEEIMSDPRDLGLEWDLHLSDEYKITHPNPKYNFTPLDWWTEKLDDEWSVAVDWYQGGPDPDPRDIEWECPLTHEGRRYRVIKYTEATEYRRYTQAEADATFCYGQWNYERHARWLEEKLVDLERWRKVELRMNLMINWRVRTGQQHTLCDGWWFMNKGQRWWETDWRYKWRGGYCYPYG